MVTLGSPASHVSNLCPGRRVLVDICLPINTEGMLPRLWETRQRLIDLNSSVDPLCMAWSRTLLYHLMPHSVVDRLEGAYGSSAKASVSVNGVEVISPFSCVGQSKEVDPNFTYQMPPVRRMAYMSMLANKSAEARSLRRRLCKRFARGGRMYPPKLGTSFRALARHLINANAGLTYINGAPIVRVDTWMPSPRTAAASLTSVEPADQPQVASCAAATPKQIQWLACRDLSVTFTTYAGQLSLALSANVIMNEGPSLNFIVEAMRIQVSQACVGNAKEGVQSE